MQRFERLPLLLIGSAWCLFVLSLLPWPSFFEPKFQTSVTIWEMAQTGLVIFVWPLVVFIEPRLLLLLLVPLTILFFLLSPWFAVGSRRDLVGRFGIAAFVFAGFTAALLTLDEFRPGPDYYAWLAAQVLMGFGYFWLARADRRAISDDRIH